MPDKVTLVGPGSLKRLVIPSSFVATIDSGTQGTLAEFRIGKGGWIVQAKATIRAASPEKVDVQLLLKATTDTTVEDRALATADNLGYATIVAIIGVHVSTTALVELVLREQGLQGADLSGIVITAIHQDDLTIFAM